MKEMDPSEATEFEKQMRKDDDLLIEVESLRATNKKLSGLPQKNPPKNLVKNIVNDAKQIQLTNTKFYNFNLILRRGVAAVFLLVAFSGGGYYYYSGLSGSEQPIQQSTENIEPWVDRNEILRFSEAEQATESTLQSEFTRSFDRLQLVTEPKRNSSASNRVLLTGSSN
jgi:hypothetical protein